ncbi:MAG TPA: SDR family oxidoreductase [Actinospica sp.]|jgi:NAD(P)-dependent dehydrogenase (short-subunit alcohol dehydrogenase family)|nr:SDR family oxidoreductase [Actinospica sp.]
MTTIKDSVALVTGGSRGIGKELVEQLYARGARKVYATARDAAAVTHPDAIGLPFEASDPRAAAALAQLAPDVTILINNAGTSSRADYLTSTEDEARRDFETNFFGPLWVTRALVPVIEANGGGHILNVHSALSWFAEGKTYSASKAAFWSQTNSLRVTLQPRGITVTGLHVGYVDTDLTTSIDADKVQPGLVAAKALDGIEAGAFEVLVDGTSEWAKAALSGPIEQMYPQLAQQGTK